MSTHKAFVYGTLKVGQPNHKVMTDIGNGIAKFLGRGRTVNPFPLVIASQYNIPFLLYKEGSGKHVQGDVFEIDDKMRDTLDDFEDHPKFYERDSVKIVMTEDDKGEKINFEMQCCSYFLKKYKPKMLDLPIFESYDSKGDHGLSYVERYARKLDNYSAKDDVQNDKEY